MRERLGRGVVPAIGWNMAAALGQQGTTFLQTLILANLLGPSGFGIFSIGSLTLVSLSWLAAAGLGLTANHYISRAHSGLDAASVARACLAIGATLSIVGGLLLAGLRSPLALHLYQIPEASFPLAAAGVGLPLITIGVVQTGILAGLGAFRSLGIVSLLQMPLQLGATAAAAILAGPHGALAALLMVLAVRLLVNAVIVKRRLQSRTPEFGVSASFRAMRSFAVPAGIVNLTMAPAIWLPAAALSRAAGPADVGLFAVALLIRTAIVFLPQQMGAVLLQGYGARSTDPAGARRFGFRMIRWGISAVIAAAIIVMLFRELVPAIFGKGFYPLIALMPLIVVGAALEGAAQLCSYMVAGQNRMWRSFVFYSTPRDVLLISLAFILAPALGISGLLWAHAIAWAVALAAVVALAMAGPQEAQS